MRTDNLDIEENIEKSTVCEDFLTVSGGAVGGYGTFKNCVVKFDLPALLAEDPKMAILGGLAEIGITVAGSLLGGLTGKYLGRGVDKARRKLKR